MSNNSQPQEVEERVVSTGPKQKTSFRRITFLNKKVVFLYVPIIAVVLLIMNSAGGWVLLQNSNPSLQEGAQIQNAPAVSHFQASSLPDIRVRPGDIATENLPPQIRYVVSVFPNMTFAQAQSEVEDRRNQLMTAMMLDGSVDSAEPLDEQKAQRVMENAQILIAIAKDQTYPELAYQADTAIKDFAQAWDLAARMSLTRSSMTWTYNAVLALSSFGEYPVWDYAGNEVTGVQAANNLLADWNYAVDMEIAAEQAARQAAYEQELALAKAQAALPAQTLPEGQPVGRPGQANQKAPGANPEVENVPAVLPVQAPEAVTDPEPEAVVSPALSPLSIPGQVTLGAFAANNAPIQIVAPVRDMSTLGGSVTPVLWTLRAGYDFLNGTQIQPLPGTWYVIQANDAWATFDVLGETYEATTLFLGETADTLMEDTGGVPSLEALRKGIEQGYDSQGRFWWNITLFYPHNREDFKVGEAVSWDGVAEFVNQTLRDLQK